MAGIPTSFKVSSEVLHLSDGTSVRIARTPGQDAQSWEETKKYLEENPEEARRWESYAKDAKQIRDHLQKQTLSDYYNSKLGSGDEHVGGKFGALEQNPEFAHIFEDIRRGGSQAAMQHQWNEPLMLKISRAVGGIPEELREVMERTHNSPMTLQEACKKGDAKALEKYLKETESDPNSRDIDGQDAKGITCLGYAVGANRTHIVKLLLQNKANPAVVDSSNNSALHYAAAYGRKELLEYFLSAGLDVNQVNTQGQTPLALAQKNKMGPIADLLKSKGAQVR